MGILSLSLILVIVQTCFHVSDSTWTGGYIASDAVHLVRLSCGSIAGISWRRATDLCSGVLVPRVWCVGIRRGPSRVLRFAVQGGTEW